MLIATNLERDMSILKDIHLFGGLDAGFLHDLFQEMKISAVERQTPIYCQGQVPEFAIVVLSGAVEVSYVNSEGDKLIVDIGRKHSVFGDFELLANSPILASCKTLTTVRLLILPKELLFKALQEPQFVENFMQIYYDRFNGDHLVRIVDRYGSLLRRICKKLIRYSDDDGIFVGSQTYLSNIVGCSRQALNREIKALQNDGLIEIHPKQVIITNLDELKKF